MVVTSENPLLDLPLVSAGRVLTSSVAFPYNSAVAHIGIHFRARVLVVPHGASKGHVYRWVLKVYDSPLLSEDCVSKFCIGFIANSWLTKIDHVRIYALSAESGAGKLSECSAHAVTSHFKLESWV